MTDAKDVTGEMRCYERNGRPLGTTPGVTAHHAQKVSRGSANIVVWIAGNDVRYFTHGEPVDPELVVRWDRQRRYPSR